MRYNSHSHHRRSIRLATYDYSGAGAYFVTICTHQKDCIFEDAALRSIAEKAWRAIANPLATLDAGDFVVMPNHVHGIVWIVDEPSVGARHLAMYSVADDRGIVDCGAATHGVPDASPLRPATRQPAAPPSGSLGAIIGSFKAVVAKRVNRVRKTPGAPVWQRNYYEHVVRDEVDLNRIREYILDNPRRWAQDPENPAKAPTHVAIRPPTSPQSSGRLR